VIEREDDEGTYLLAAGEVDVLTAPKLAAALVRILHTVQGDVVVDLSETLFIDSAGLHVLLNAQRRLTRQGRKLRVICGSGPVRRVIEMARLLDTLNVEPAEE
jgi:anti-sigma B factor antagonist